MGDIATTSVAESLGREVQEPSCASDPGAVRTPRCRCVLGAKMRKRHGLKRLEQDMLEEHVLAQSHNEPHDHLR